MPMYSKDDILKIAKESEVYLKKKYGTHSSVDLIEQLEIRLS